MKTRIAVALLGGITGALVLAQTETPRLTSVESALESKVAASTTEGLSAAACELPNEQKSIRLAVIGDSGTGGIEQYQVGEQMESCRAKSGFDSVLMLGDNIYRGKSPQDFERKFEAPYKSLLDAGVKFYASIGNHDDTNERLYKPFNMGGQRYYSFKKGNATFFALDSNYMDLAQLEWLERELSSTSTPWKICFMHHPLYSDGRYHGPDIDLRAHLEPLFEKYGVNVVFSGRDHVYERLKPEHGIYYFVLGNSGELRFRNLKASRRWQRGSIPIAVLWWWRSQATSCISRRFREPDRWWIQARWIARKSVTPDPFIRLRLAWFPAHTSEHSAQRAKSRASGRR